MEEIKKFWNSLDGVFIVRKRELFLGGASSIEALFSSKNGAFDVLSAIE